MRRTLTQLWPTLISLVGASLLAEPAVAAEETLLHQAVSSQLANLEAFRAEMHVWEKSIQGFRRDHNFVLLTGLANQDWRIKYDLDTSASDLRTTFIRLQYTFHLQISGSFGYYLGTTTGLSLPGKGRRGNALETPRTYLLPTMTAGFAWNPQPALRLLVGAEAFLERLQDFNFRTGISGNNHVIDITGRGLGMMVAVDLFPRLSWAIRGEAQYSIMRTIRPHGSGTYPTSAIIERKEMSYAVGLVYNLL